MTNSTESSNEKKQIIQRKVIRRKIIYEEDRQQANYESSRNEFNEKHAETSYQKGIEVEKDKQDIQILPEIRRNGEVGGAFHVGIQLYHLFLCLD
ncbi:hypothetical protein F8M41_020723 [Gigaspora margarita]|uniref:Uncharacterized protein n=1 Tax=Gigaspora margarita TaxID=4874 RepID=A0A8H4B1U5_GIGMA|nr:hypothetical protein F8M41_020723 [Gigaspora margarita]